MTDCCLHLLCPQAVEERAVDLLLSLVDAGVFTSAPAHAHGFAHGRLNAAEQVSGRSEAGLIQLVLPGAQLQRVLDELQRELRGSGLRYWVSPLLSRGELA